jgi:hypothetical protein
MNNYTAEIIKGQHYNYYNDRDIISMSNRAITGINLSPGLKKRNNNKLYLSNNLLKTIIIPPFWNIIILDNNPLTEIVFQSPADIFILDIKNTLLLNCVHLPNLVKIGCNIQFECIQYIGVAKINLQN